MKQLHCPPRQMPTYPQYLQISLYPTSVVPAVAARSYYNYVVAESAPSSIMETLSLLCAIWQINSTALRLIFGAFRASTTLSLRAKTGKSFLHYRKLILNLCLNTSSRPPKLKYFSPTWTTVCVWSWKKHRVKSVHWTHFPLSLILYGLIVADACVASFRFDLCNLPLINLQLHATFREYKIQYRPTCHTSIACLTNHDTLTEVTSHCQPRIQFIPKSKNQHQLPPLNFFLQCCYAYKKLQTTFPRP